MNRMNDLFAFRKGYKPAYLTSVRDTKVSRLKKEFPNYVEVRGNTTIIFFHGEIGKEWFERNGVFQIADEFGNVIDRDFDPYVLGLSLGFPPKACHFFQKCYTDFEYFMDNRIGVDYYGIRFMSSVHTLRYDIGWLTRNRPVSKDIRGHITITDLRGINPTIQEYILKDDLSTIAEDTAEEITNRMKKELELC
jgi:hypothetical protein